MLRCNAIPSRSLHLGATAWWSPSAYPSTPRGVCPWARRDGVGDEAGWGREDEVMRRCDLLVVAVVALATAGPAWATFPGENGALAFSGVDATSHTVQTYRLAPGGGAPTQLTAPLGAVWNECPAWSADGRQIYFDSVDRSTTNPAHIYRIDATGGSRTLADSPDAPTHLCPTVSRSGTELAAIEYKDDGSEGIVRMQAD